ncbi:MAG: DUF938 domain-containing protein, partial [Wenzhouxiangellaceae bacterium]|nr:DUF938 domain-containing protein [Wenzhouxiangellaceae bacterium]
ARNREPILDVLRAWLPADGTMLEIGAGTGQHARHFAAVLKGWQWQPSEHPSELATLRAGLVDTGLDNLLPPIALDVSGGWPDVGFDAVFSANTAHIMHWNEVRAMFAGIGTALREGGLFFLYGPFKRAGSHHAPSNERFDANLRARDPEMGLRDLVDIDRLARVSGLERFAELRMPANNHTLIFQKGSRDD